MPRPAIAIAAALCALLLPAGTARSAVTIGEAFAPDATATCSGNATFAQQHLPGVVPTYTMPSSGVITSWSHRTGAVPDEAKLKVLRGENPFQLVGESAVALTPSETKGTYQVRIPVQAGDVLGLYMESSAPCMSPSVADYSLYVLLLDHTEGSMVYVPFTSRRLDVSAVLEADGDGDGFGDESQDRCPGSAGAEEGCLPQGGAPASPPSPDVDSPETVFKKRPADKTHRRRATYRFAADEPGARFRCRLDRKPWKACSSPLRLKKLTIGRHVFRVKALDAAGNIDPTAAEDRFRVLA